MKMPSDQLPLPKGIIYNYTRNRAACLLWVSTGLTCGFPRVPLVSDIVTSCCIFAGISCQGLGVGGGAGVGGPKARGIGVAVGLSTPAVVKRSTKGRRP